MRKGPGRHRAHNTYRFLTFSERLANVNIDVIHRIDRTGSHAEEVETYFYEGLEKWRDLNCTEHFVAFRKEVLGRSQSFNQLIYHQNGIIESLKNHLQISNSLAYQPLLDLVVQLARDLQTDFYPHFRDFFVIITSLLNTQDTELLEWSFTSLSYLYKYLWRHMVKDITEIYSLYSSLLCHRREHIRHFTAESFPFLMRKVPDLSALFNFMFADLEEERAKVEGVGQLLFEMCKGVQNTFHSCAAKVFPIIFQKLGPITETSVLLPWDAVCEAVGHMAKACATYVHKEHFHNLWSCLQGCILSLQGKTSPEDRGQVSDQIHRLLQIYLVLVKSKEGSKVTHPSEVCEMLIKMLQTSQMDLPCCRTLLEVISTLLLAENISLPDLLIEETTREVYGSGFERSLILEFSEDMFEMSKFEQLLLPNLIKYVEESLAARDVVARDEVLGFLVKLILTKAEPPTDGSMAFEKYPLLFTGQARVSTCSGVGVGRGEALHHILSLLQLSEDGSESDLERSWGALIILPHLRPLETEKVLPLVHSLLDQLLTALEQSDHINEGWMFVTCQAVSTLLSLTESLEILNFLPVERVRNLMKNSPADVSALLLGDLYYTRLTLCGYENNSQDILLDLYKELRTNLSSSISKVRLLSLRILNHFEVRLPKKVEDASDEVRQSVFVTLLQAELVPETVHDYREKLLHLRRLRHDLVQQYIPEGPYDEVPLQYLIGMLYKNFSPLWDPVIELIISHAYGMENKAFWHIYYEHLDRAATLAEKELKRELEETPKENGTPSHPTGHVRGLYQHQLHLAKARERTDHANFRFLLWKAMGSFTDRVEPRSKELSPLLLRFVHNEYYPADVLAAPTEDIRRKRCADDQSAVSELENENLTGDDQGTARVEQVLAAVRKPRRAAVKQLLAHLRVFSKFTNPKSLYLEPKLKELYTQLLCHHLQEVQKIALECVLTYKHPHMLPYRENLQRLLDDKSFKEEIIHFSIAEETTIVAPAHRTELIPVIMRILYGRMKSKTGNKTQGRSGASTRANIVLHFLAGSLPQELRVFLDLLLEPVKHLTEGSCLSAVLQSMKTMDISKVLPLGRQHGLLNSMDVVLRKLGHLINDYLPELLQILLCINTSVSQMLQQRDKIKPRCINLLKNLRRLGIDQIAAFFSSFESYPFTTDEIDAVFSSTVWPQIGRLPTEGQYAPTSLLKLIYVWSKSSRYFPLLAKELPDHPGCGILTNVFALLSPDTVAESTATLVMDIVDSLLSEPDFVPTAQETALTVRDTVFPELSTVTEDTPTMGTMLILPHVSAILQRLNKAVRNRVRMMKKQFQKQVSKDLSILSRISRFVQDKEQSSVLINLLMPYLCKPNTSQDTEIDILQTIQNLLQHCAQPSSFLKPLGALFSVIPNKLSRQKLCAVFQSLADLDGSLTYITETITKLNAFDCRHLDDINFDVRLSAFQQATSSIREMNKLDRAYLIPIMHNCFFSLQLGEMTLSDNATLCLCAIIQQVAATESSDEEYKELISRTLLDNLRSGLKSKVECVQQEYTTLLCCLIRTFPQRSEFQDLVQLTDPDPEADFFEIMKHIQIHRRARALRKLAKHLDEGKVTLSSRSLMNYIMPYATSVLFNEKMLKHENMISASVELVGAACNHLSWSPYTYQLKRYIHVLQTGEIAQKLAVSLLLSVLEAFHFDPESLRKKFEAVQATEDETAVAGGEEDVTEAMELNNVDGEEKVEVAEGLDGEGMGCVEVAEECTPAVAVKKSVVFQPRSKQELENLIRHIQDSVTDSILPRLQNCLIAKVKRDEHHKLVKSKLVNDEELVRIPIAFAVVKLMQTLPKEIMENNLPNILINICMMLRNRAQEIRDPARNTLIKIMETLGPRYLLYLLKEMQSTLTKGYQVHVLTYTVYTVLKGLMPKLSSSDLDPCIDNLVEIFNYELFGKIAEEKEVKGIVCKLMEAKKSKSYDSYEILGQFVGKGQVARLILPLKEILENTTSLKQARKVHETFRRIVSGLLLNDDMPADALLLLSHGLVTESLPLMMKKIKGKELRREPPHPGLKPQSCLLLPPTPSRQGEKAAVSAKTNMHILVDTGLRLLHLSLKRSRVNCSFEHILEMIDPFVQVLIDCLQSMHVKVITTALQCLIWVLKLPLRSMENLVVELTQHLFVLLKDYARAGAARGENFHLVVNCFKAITVLVKNVTRHTLTEKQLQVLLGYAEEDIYDTSRQAAAFGLLKAILCRRLLVPEMGEVMQKVAKLAVTGQSESVRVQCRQVYMKFILDYPLGKELKTHLNFIVAQLSYEHEIGRDSALEMLAHIFQTFPQDLLHQHCVLFFVPVALMIINDDSPKCKKMAALAAQSLLSKVDNEHKDSMFAMVLAWFESKKVSHRRLAAHTCGLFIEAEGVFFEKRFATILPILEAEINPERFQEVEGEKEEKATDHLLFGLLTMTVKMVKNCSFIQLLKPNTLLANIWGHLQAHLWHPHSWVWLTAAQLFGRLFASLQPEELVAQWKTGKPLVQGKNMSQTPAAQFLWKELDVKMKDLALAFCRQLQSKFLDQALGDQRTCIFKFLGAVAVDLGKDRVKPFLALIIAPLYRELNSTYAEQDPTLKNLSQEIIEVLKRLVGLETFSLTFAAVQRQTTEKRSMRKRQKAIQTVANPDIAARKKFKKHKNKVEAKKRKMDVLRPIHKAKRPRSSSLKDLAIVQH
ncbi:small subunit processome component 20 homolog isoform X2 [Narcine bancroftii]|uniref:small subunit processome component 20 homolog isoform X2 n=1 Tax=Narcine bancroftii TaxID=1343680 RepID=UPI0038311DAA